MCSLTTAYSQAGFEILETQYILNLYQNIEVSKFYKVKTFIWPDTTRFNYKSAVCFVVNCTFKNVVIYNMCANLIKWTNKVICACRASLLLTRVCMTTAPLCLICMFPCVCMWNSYFGPHWQGRIEGLHCFVELSADVVEHPEARLQIWVDAVSVMLNCFQEELLYLGLQGAMNTHTQS